MKSVVIVLLSLYQQFISPLFHQLLGVKKMCRYSVSCSEYAKQVIEEYGILRGGVLAMKRLLSCQPFGQVTLNNLQVTKKS